MVLHIYHAAIGEKEFQFSTEINKLTEETYAEDIKKTVDEVSQTMLESLSGEDALCCACKIAPAVKLIHHTMLFDQTFPPRVEDIPMQVCASASCAEASEAQYLMDMEEASMNGMSSPNGCFQCHKKSTGDGTALLRCSRCKVAKYCSAECQRTNWRAHKTACVSQK